MQAIDRTVINARRQLAETRYRYPYIGAARFTQRGDPISQHAFRTPQSAITWTMVDQTMAVDHGFFVERSTASEWGAVDGPAYGADNHARIIPLAHGHYVSDASVMSAVEAAVFRRDPWAMKLLAFIVQQDSYGYAGAWDKRIQRLTATLRWYKGEKLAHRRAVRTLSEHGRAMALVRWGRKHPRPDLT